MIRSAILAASITLMSASTALASPITLYYDTFVSGTIGMTSFTNELVQFVGTADTDDAIASMLPTTPASIDVDNVELTIGGVGTFTVTETLTFFGSNGAGFIGLAPAMNSNTLLTTDTAALIGYDFTTEFGQVITGGQTFAGNLLSTTGGTLVLDAATQLTVSFRTEVEDPITVSEPASLAILGLGLIGVASMGRKSRR